MQTGRDAHPVLKYVGHVLIKVKNCQNLQSWIREEAGSLLDEILLLSYSFNDSVEIPSVLFVARDVLRAVPSATRGVTPSYLRRDLEEAIEGLDSLFGLAARQKDCVAEPCNPRSGRRVSLSSVVQRTNDETVVFTGLRTSLYFAEEHGDLFSSTCSKAHCVSADQRQGAGIAKSFRMRYGRIAELKAQNKGVGEVAYFLNSPGEYVFTLITKERYFDKPTYENLNKCLIELARICKQLGVKTLCIPRLGCGLDGLDWNAVKRVIFMAADWGGLEMTVYTMETYV